MKEILFLILISTIYLTLHLYSLPFPPVPYGDGYYYVPSARSILAEKKDPNDEHPPLGKLIIASGIKIFGDNPYGWRLPGVLAGFLANLVFYFFAKEITKDTFVAVVSVLLLNSETLWFLHSQIEMLEIFVSLFILISLFFFWKYFQKASKKDLIFSGIALGLALATKWVAALILILTAALFASKKFKRRDFFLFVTLIIAVYTAAYSLYIGENGLLAFFRLQGTILGAHLGGGKSINTNASPAITWLLSLKSISYVTSPAITAQLNPVILSSSLPTLMILFARSLKNKHLPSLFVVLSAAILYFPWLFVPQPTFLFYILPAIPFFCLSIAIGLRSLWQRNTLGKITTAAYLGSTFLFFIFWW